IPSKSAGCPRQITSKKGIVARSIFVIEMRPIWIWKMMKLLSWVGGEIICIRKKPPDIRSVFADFQNIDPVKRNIGRRNPKFICHACSGYARWITIRPNYLGMVNASRLNHIERWKLHRFATPQCSGDGDIGRG